MKFEGNRKLAITLIMLGIILTFFGSSLAYFNWETSESQKTEVAVTVSRDFMCTIDGGGSIESSDYQLVPTGCTDPNYAIQREVKVKPTLYKQNGNVLLDMWIDVKKLTTGLSNSENFKYVLTTSSTSCTEGVISEGTFTGLTDNGKTENILSNTYTNTTEDTYYLYVWLDSAETSSETMNQEFSLSLNGMCTKEEEYTVTFDANSGIMNSTSYTSAGQSTYTVSQNGLYKIELWGAQGGTSGSNPGGYGGYTSGLIDLNKDEKLNFYVGGTTSSNVGGYNGGGNSLSGGTVSIYSSGGGGATDVRYENSNLSDRIMVAGGGGGASVNNTSNPYRYAGGISGGDGAGSASVCGCTGGNQVSGGANYCTTQGTGGFGYGGSYAITTTGYTSGGGGGSGYYGGAGGSPTDYSEQISGSGAGGSSYISGHTGCVAIISSTNITPKNGCTTGTDNNDCSIHYSGKTFSNTLMIDGNGYQWTTTKDSLQQMPNSTGGYYESGKGHTGNGVAKITLLRTTKNVTNGEEYGTLPTPKKIDYTFSGWNTEPNGTGETITSESIANLNSDQTLYAIWTINTYTISYNANGGSGAPESQTKEHGTTLTLSTTTPTRSGYNFLGWSTSSTATSATYSAGGNYTTNESITLYAVWQVPILYLYSYGDENTAVTGGWVGQGMLFSNTVTNGTAQSPTLTRTGSFLGVREPSVSAGYYGTVRTNYQIDLTKYKTLNAHFGYIINNCTAAMLVFQRSQTYWMDSAIVRGISAYSTGETTYSIDVSGLSGYYDVGFGMAAWEGQNDINLIQMWLE